MSTLIKGMEMPHDCDECRLCAFIPVGDYGIHRKCLPLNANAEITIRRADCPLVPIPEHGDLIDRNETIKALWRALYEYEDRTEKQFIESSELDVGDWILYRIFVQNMSNIDRQTISQMPTIILAEEEE